MTTVRPEKWLNDVICSPLEYSSSPVSASTTYSVACDDLAARIEESEDEAEADLADGAVAGEAVPDADTGEDLSAGPEDGE